MKVSLTVRGLRELWQAEPRWRIVVMAAVASTLLAFVFPPIWRTGTGASAPAPPSSAPLRPVAAADPQSDQRLQTFTAAVTGLSREPRAGFRCEQLVDALKGINGSDRKRVVGRASPQATAAQPALAAADNCATQIDASNGHFMALARAVAAASKEQTSSAMKDAVSALKLVDGFDQSRARYSNETALIAKARDLADTLAASDANIAALLEATAAFANDRSGPSYLRLADALKRLTDFDRGILTAQQRAALDAANQAMTTLAESRTRLAKLLPIAGALNDGARGETAEHIFQAVTAITPFDETVATPSQKDALEKVRAAARPLSWSALQDRVRTLAQGETPQIDQAIVDAYRLVKDTPASQLSAQERALLGQAQAASDALSASDTRLGALLTAAEAWRRRKGSVDRGILSALHAITPFDHARFRDHHEAAWDTLSTAEAMILGPELGLSAATKGHVPIYVFSSAQGDLNRIIAERLRDGLAKDFLIAADRQDAAILVDVAVENVGEPTVELGVRTTWVTTATLVVRATWSGDVSTLFAGVVPGQATDRDKDNTRANALKAAVAEVVKKFSELSQ